MYGQRSKILNFKKDEENFWPSFVDLLSVIVLIFLLLLFAYMIVAHTKTVETEAIQKEINQVVEEVIGYRREIAADLKKAFAHSDLTIDVDEQTGAITFSGDILFNKDSARINSEFKEMLREFIPGYVEVLLSRKHRDNIAQIIVEGHTDDDGSYMYNLDLSQRRAFAVVKYILSDSFPDFKYREELKKYLTANGKSESTLIKNSDGSVNKSKSRRVEFKFNLKDETLIKKINDVIKG